MPYAVIEKPRCRTSENDVLKHLRDLMENLPVRGLLPSTRRRNRDTVRVELDKVTKLLTLEVQYHNLRKPRVISEVYEDRDLCATIFDAKNFKESRWEPCYLRDSTKDIIRGILTNLIHDRVIPKGTLNVPNYSWRENWIRELDLTYYVSWDRTIEEIGATE